MNPWPVIFDVLMLLLAATVLGWVLERLKQHAILGYLLAGTLVGPQMMSDPAAISSIAELGVAFLLFMIGLEFSWRRLRSMGAVAFGGGCVAVVATIGLSMAVGVALGLEVRTSFAIGAMVALSSTAVVMRLLADRTKIDSVYGRNVMGILLLQDIAVVPLVLVVTFLGGSEVGTVGKFGWAAARALGLALVLVVCLFVVLKYVVPRFFRTREAAGNRDLPVLLSIVTALGSAWGSHALGFSPVLGAFIGGVILAESPIASRIRADIAPLKTLFITLFFASIGTLASPEFVLSHWQLIVVMTAAVLVGKFVVIGGVAWLFRIQLRYAIATGLCLAQIGEFSFVIAQVAQSKRIISDELFDLMISVTVLTLFVTPYLVDVAPRVAGYVRRRVGGNGEEDVDDDGGGGAAVVRSIVIIGFGPAGEAVAEELIRRRQPQVAIEMNHASADKAAAKGIRTIIGDASHSTILNQAGVESARAVVVTVPDPIAAKHIVAQIRNIASEVPILVRARYKRHLDALADEGATVVIDEEIEVGLQLASHLRKRLEME